MNDYYKILGVEREASQAEIKKAYQRLARKFHPDVSKEKDAEASFKEVREAYDCLKDPEARARYDSTGENSCADLAKEGEELVASLVLTYIEETTEIPPGSAQRPLRFVLLDLLARAEIGSASEISTCRVKEARLIKQLRRLKYKGSAVNIVGNVLNSRLQAVRGEIANHERNIRCVNFAREHVDDYDVEPSQKSYGVPGIAPVLGRIFADPNSAG